MTDRLQLVQEHIHSRVGLLSNNNNNNSEVEPSWLRRVKL